MLNVFYFLGRLAERNQCGGLNPAVEYYEEALQMLQEQSITELTCKLLHALSQYYNKRGMVGKAEEHFENLQSIFNYITENIKDKYTLQVFLSKPGRKVILEQL